MAIENQTFNLSRPLSMIPLIHEMVQSMLNKAEKQLKQLNQAKQNPHLLEKITISAILNDYQEQQALMPDYQKPCQQWRRYKLNSKQLIQVTEIEYTAKILKKTVAEILGLAQELGKGTPDKIA